MLLGFLFGSVVIPVQAGGFLQIPPTPLPDPLETPLPSSGPIPISAWRPPLYPVPWALGKHDHFYFIRPIAADEINWPLSDYRYAGTYFGPKRPHTGIDITAPTGTPVMAAGSGQIVWTGYGLYRGYPDPSDPYGLAIAIAHDFGYGIEPLYTLYAHLSEIIVIEGQRVEAGDIIGLSGSTGFATGPHLHFEVRLGANKFYNTYNPELWLAPPQGWGVLVGLVANTEGSPSYSKSFVITNLETEQVWYVETYNTYLTINSDPYYKENFILSDLPQGTYEISIGYTGHYYSTTVTILPGAVTYFSFKGTRGFDSELPKEDVPENIPYLLVTPEP